MFLQKLTAAGNEAKQIAAGKKKGKTLDELIEVTSQFEKE